MDIFHLLGNVVEDKFILSLKSPEANLVEEKIRKLVDKDIQKRGRSTILSFKSQSNKRCPVSQSLHEEYTSKATPLIWAACKGQTTLVEFFLSRGADVNARDIHNRTALIWAADRGDLEMALCLIKHGADLEAKEKRFESTALNWAAYMLHPPVVKALVDAGAVIDTPNKFGSTALELGVGSFEITEILLKAGAHIPQRYKDFLQDWDFVEKRFSMAILFVQYGAPVVETMFDQIRTNMGEEKEKQLRAVLKVLYNCIVF